ncbi:43777_t:CDS:1, partial [Gigaspora margarita]
MMNNLTITYFKYKNKTLKINLEEAQEKIEHLKEINNIIKDTNKILRERIEIQKKFN